jgi:hypothetical protein
VVHPRLPSPIFLFPLQTNEVQLKVIWAGLEDLSLLWQQDEKRDDHNDNYKGNDQSPF